MQSYTNSHVSFNRWLIFIGLVLFGIYLAYDKGLIALVVSTDESYLSIVILSIFVVATLHAGWRAFALGNETATAFALRIKTKSKQAFFTLSEDDEILVDGAAAHTSYIHQHLAFMAEKSRHRSDMQSQELLLDRLENTINRGHEFGWFIADLMIRLGLLGTVVGFILMLGSISSVDTVDVHAVQQLLTNMSDGMRTALYTTFSGLTAGILLSFQYQLLDQGADRLLAEIIEVSEVHVAQHLRRCASLFVE